MAKAIPFYPTMSDGASPYAVTQGSERPVNGATGMNENPTRKGDASKSGMSGGSSPHTAATLYQEDKLGTPTGSGNRRKPKTLNEVAAEDIFEIPRVGGGSLPTR